MIKKGLLHKGAALFLIPGFQHILIQIRAGVAAVHNGGGCVTMSIIRWKREER